MGLVGLGGDYLDLIYFIVLESVPGREGMHCIEVCGAVRTEYYTILYYTTLHDTILHFILALCVCN
jgi:hypothetical protein